MIIKLRNAYMQNCHYLTNSPFSDLQTDSCHMEKALSDGRVRFLSNTRQIKCVLSSEEQRAMLISSLNEQEQPYPFFPVLLLAFGC